MLHWQGDAVKAASVGHATAITHNALASYTRCCTYRKFVVSEDLMTFF